MDTTDPSPTAAVVPADPGDGVVVRRGDRLVIPARRPAILVVPFALVTEVVGLLFVLAGYPIGPFVMAAPVVALVVTALLFRPTLELTRDGLLQRQYPFSSLLRWDAIASCALTRAGNRTVLAYTLVPGASGPRRQPAAALLRAANRPYDGGYFADALRGRPEAVLAVVDAYRADSELRATLPPAQR